MSLSGRHMKYWGISQSVVSGHTDDSLHSSGSCLKDCVSSNHDTLQSGQKGPKLKTGSSINSLFYKYLYFFFQADSKESACNAGDPNPWVGKIPWGREWQPSPVFLSGKFHGQRSLAGHNPWGRKEWDTTEQLTHTDTFFSSRD